MNEKDQTSWENFLNLAVLRPNLIVASIYIAAFELLKNRITRRIQKARKSVGLRESLLMALPSTRSVPRLGEFGVFIVFRFK